jgi:hypothetical protein
MQIVGQILKGTVTVVDIYGKEQTLGKGQTIVLGDTIKAQSGDALILFDNNPTPFTLSGDTAIEIDDDFLAYLASEAKKAQEGVETALAEDIQDEDLQAFMENDDENPRNTTDTSLLTSSINSIDLFHTDIHTLTLERAVVKEESAPSNNLQFALVGDNGQYYLRGSDTETLIVLAHAREGTLSDADNDRHFEVLGVNRGDIPVDIVNAVLAHTNLPLATTEDVPAVVKEVVTTLQTLQDPKENITDTMLREVLGLDVAEPLSAGELSYLNALIDSENITPKHTNFLTEVIRLGTEVYDGVLSPTSLDLKSNSDTGTSNTDDLTKDNTPTFSMGLAADVSVGDVVSIYANGTLLTTHTLTNTEVTAHTLDITLDTLTDDTYVLTSTVKDAHGHESTPSMGLSVEVDTSTPVPTVDIIDASDTGISQTDNVTQIRTPTIVGEVEAFAEVVITDGNGQIIGETQADSSGAYSITTNSLDDGSYGLEVTATDTSGNVETSTQNIVIDTSADVDNNFTVSAVEVYQITNNTEKTNVAVGFTGVDTDTVSIAVTFTDSTGKSVEAQATQVNGTWSVTGVDLSTLKDGNISISALTTDDAGNTDTTPLSSLDLDTSADVDNNFTITVAPSDETTNNAEKTNVSFALDGIDADTVSVEVTFTDTDGKTVVVDASKSGDTWSVTEADLSTLADGTVNIVALSTDDAGNTDTASDSLDLDTSADVDNNFTITVAPSDDITNNVEKTNVSFVLDGIDEDTVSVEVTFTDTEHQTVVVDAVNNHGVWSVTEADLSALADGTVNIVALSTDDAGNIDTASDSLRLDTHIDAVKPVKHTDADKKVSFTFDFTGVEDETGATGVDKLEIRDTNGDVLIATATKNNDGSWSIVSEDGYGVSGNVVGNIIDGIDKGITITEGTTGKPFKSNISVITYDVAGNTATVDTNVDEGERLTVTIDDALVNGAEQNAVTYNVTGLDEGTVATLTFTDVNGHTVVIHEVTENGNGTVNLTGLDDGTITLTVTTTDGVNTINGIGDTTVLDTTDPTLTITDNTNTTTNGDITYIFTFNEAVTGFSIDDVGVTNGTKGTFTAVSTTEYTLVVTPTIGFEGDVTVSVDANVAIDAAGNDNEAATDNVQAVDTKAPDVLTVTYLGGDVDSSNEVDNAVSDTTPTIKGEAEAGSTVTIKYNSIDSITGELQEQTQTVTASGDGKFEVTLENILNEGDTVVTITATDALGNISDVTTYTIDVDTIAPIAPTITSVSGDEDKNTSLQADLIVSDTTPTIKGKAEAGSTVGITYTDAVGDTYTDTVKASTTGDYSVTLSHALTENANTELTLTSTDVAGNVSSVTQQSINIDTTADGDATPFALILAASDLDGVNADEADNVALTLEGIDSDAVSVQVVFSDTNSGTEDVVVDAIQAVNGTWSIGDADISGLTNGDITVTATVVDIAGNITENNNRFILNKNIPDAPTVVIIEDGEPNDGILKNNEIIGNDIDININIPNSTPHDGILTVTTTGVTLGADKTLHLAINDFKGVNNYIGITTTTTEITDGGKTWDVDFSIDQSGTWTLILTTNTANLSNDTIRFEYQEIPAENETLTVSATIADSVGNISTAGTDTVTRADETATSAPTVTISEDSNNDGMLTNGEIDGDADIRIDMPEETVLGDTLNITVNGTALAGVSVTQEMIDNGYTFTQTIPAEGETLTVTATITDQAIPANTSEAGTDTVTRADETGPTITAVTLSSDAGADNTYVAGDEVSVTVTYSETVNVDTTGGTPSIALSIGGTSVDATYASGTGTTDLVFTYTVLAGQTDADGISIDANSISLNSGSIQDTSGNDATLTHTAVADSASALVDTTADQDNNLSISSMGSATTLNITGVDADVNDADVKISKVEANDSGIELTGSYSAGVFTLDTAMVGGETTLEVSVTDTVGNTATSVTYHTYLGTSGDESLTVSTSGQYDFIDLGAGTDSLLVSDNVTIDLSKVHNVESISLGNASSLSGTGVNSVLTLSDLGLESNDDSIIIKDSDTDHNNDTIKIDKSQFTDSDGNGTPDRTPTDSDGDGTTDYYSYTTTDNQHTIQIDATIDVVWQ